jgi:gelsolin
LPRLFHWTDVLGTLRVEEIYNFTQDDLVSDDVMMLDAKNEIYIWIGRDSRKRKQQLSLKLAKQYLDACCDGRSPNCPIIEIPENNEPWIFTKYFHGWRKKKVFIDPYEVRLLSIT